MIKRYFLFLFGLMLILITCKKNDIPLTQVTPNNMDTIAANYYEEYHKLFPLKATMNGDYRYNDQLPITIDKDFINGEIEFYTKIQSQLSNLDYQQLTEDKKSIYTILNRNLEEQIKYLSFHPEYIPLHPSEGMHLLFPFLASGKGAQPFRSQKDYDDWLSRMNQFPLWMDAAIVNFNEGITNKFVLPKKLVRKIISQLRMNLFITKNLEHNIFYESIRHFPSSFDQRLRDKYTQLYKNAILRKIIPSYLKMANYLESTYLPKARNTYGINALPDGKKQYSFWVKKWTSSDISTFELEKIGLKEVERIRMKMEKIKNELNDKVTLKDFLQSLKSDENALMYKNQMQLQVAFDEIESKIAPQLTTLFTNPSKVKFQILPMEDLETSLVFTAKKYWLPNGFTTIGYPLFVPNPSNFNITNGMESLFLHDITPGSALFIQMQRNNHQLPKFIKNQMDGAITRGWAAYSETLGYDLGLYNSLYQQLGALNSKMLNALSLVIDVQIHTGKLSREDAIKLILENTTYDENIAVSVVENCIVNPGEGLAAKIGQLKISALRKKYESQLGEQFSLKKFHDALLSNGNIPLDVLEDNMDRWSKTTK